MATTELMEKWLWMEAIQYALSKFQYKYKEQLYPTRHYNEWQHLGWTEVRKNIFQYALNHWETPEFQGDRSRHDRFSIGYDLTITSTGVIGTYKTYEIEILWPEVKKFIQKMLSPEIEGRQMTLFELLMEEAR